MSAWTFYHCEIFECADLKFAVSGQSKQTSIDTHTRAQCSHASVGLAQAKANPNSETRSNPGPDCKQGLCFINLRRVTAVPP